MKAGHLNRRPGWRIVSVLLCTAILGCSSLIPKQRLSVVPRQTLIPTGRQVISIDAINGIPFVQVYVNGQGPYRFVLDTGSTGLMLSPETLDQLDPAPAIVPIETKLRTTEGEVRAGYCRHVKLIKLGDVEFHDLDAAIADTRTVFEAYYQVDGILGVQVFANCQLTIDYLHNQLVLEAIDKTQPLSVKDKSVLPLKRFPNSRFAIPLRINKQILWCLLDSGHDCGIVVPEEIAMNLTLATPPVRLHGSTATLSGHLPVYKAQLNSSAFLGSHELVRPVIWVQGNIPLIGGEILRHFRLTIDQQAKVARFGREAGDQLSDE